MENLAQHVQDVSENAVRAGARRVEIKVVESAKDDTLVLEIVHDGPGYSAAARDTDPGEGGKREAVRKAGVGIYKLTGAAQMAGGDWSVGLTPTGATQVRLSFQMSHPDRPPLGPIEEMYQLLIAGHPETDFRLEYTTQDTTQTWDTAAAEDFGETRLPTRIEDENDAGN
jgi:hypothetical protein